jgi:hypothetical protein
MSAVLSSTRRSRASTGYFIWTESAQGWVPVANGVNALKGQTAQFGTSCVVTPTSPQRHPHLAVRNRWRYARDATVPARRYPDSILDLDAIVQTYIDVCNSKPEPSISDRTVSAKR